MRREFEMTEEQHKELLEACKPVPYMLGSGGRPLFGSQQENANRAWQRLGDELGFMWNSVQPVPGKGSRFFSAEVVERSLGRRNRSERL